jgi:hypothetical protein
VPWRLAHPLAGGRVVVCVDAALWLLLARERLRGADVGVLAHALLTALAGDLRVAAVEAVVDVARGVLLPGPLGGREPLELVVAVVGRRLARPGARVTDLVGVGRRGRVGEHATLVADVGLDPDDVAEVVVGVGRARVLVLHRLEPLAVVAERGLVAVVVLFDDRAVAVEDVGDVGARLRLVFAALPEHELVARVEGVLAALVGGAVAV